MNTSPFFSVIIPAYQAETTIRRCIESIINQTYTNFEIIIINDGSTDKTYDICKEYENNKKVRLVSQENKGIAKTRQIGLNLAKGKFIQFIDADDWIDIPYFENVHSLLTTNNYDIVILDYYAETINSTKYKSLGIKNLNREELIKGLVTNIPGVLWNKIIKRDLLIKNNIGFNSNLSYCEDWVISYELFNIPAKIYYYNKAFYHYDLYSNQNSLARKIDNRTLKNRRDYLEYILQLGIKKSHPNIYETQRANYAYIIIRSNSYSNSQFIKEFSDLKLNITYQATYRKIVLKIASIINVRVAHYFDCMVRKIMLH